MRMDEISQGVYSRKKGSMDWTPEAPQHLEVRPGVAEGRSKRDKSSEVDRNRRAWSSEHVWRSVQSTKLKWCSLRLEQWPLDLAIWGLLVATWQEPCWKGGGAESVMGVPQGQRVPLIHFYIPHATPSVWHSVWHPAGNNICSWMSLLTISPGINHLIFTCLGHGKVKDNILLTQFGVHLYMPITHFFILMEL